MKDNKQITNVIGSAWPFKKDEVEPFAWIDNVFTKDECKKIINLSDKYVKQKGEIGYGSRAKISSKIRKSSVNWIPTTSNNYWIYKRLTDTCMELNNKFFKFNLYGFGESLQLTYYKAPAGHYEKHVDRTYNGLVRKLSMSVQLSDPEKYKGGDLLMYEGDFARPTLRNQGSVIVFPSFMEHQVGKVTKGERYSLVGWVTGENFK